MTKLYLSFCRRWGPRGMTVSAWAWVSSLEEDGSPWLRNRIDGLFLLLAGQHNHCQSQFQKERH
jgi:hypothetical protein